MSWNVNESLDASGPRNGRVHGGGVRLRGERERDLERERVRERDRLCESLSLALAVARGAVILRSL